MKALVLAAGFGTRLLPLTAKISKVALPLAGVPVIVRVLRRLRSCGVDEFVVNLHHAPQSVRDCLGEHGERVSFAPEPEILGTGGALHGARDELSGGGTFLMVNGDCYYGELDLEAALEFHRRRGSLATMVLLDMPPGGEFRGVETGSGGRIVRIAGRPAEAAGQVRKTLHFPGIHIFEPEMLSCLEPGFSDVNRQLYPLLIGKGEPVHGFHTSFVWHDLGTPRRFLQPWAALIERETGGSGIILPPGARLGANTRLESPVEAGAGLTTGGNCTIAGSLICAGVSLGDDVTLRDSLVGENVSLESGTVLDGCVAANVDGKLEIESWKEQG